jgi:hypothetical protein
MADISNTTSSLGWIPYYWNCAKHFGQECYRTWREELASAFLIMLVAYFISRGTDTKALADLQVALLSSAIGLGIIAFYHLLRAPFLAYTEAMIGDSSTTLPTRYGIFGIFVLAAMIVGVITGGLGLYAFGQPKTQLSIGFVAPTEKDAELFDLRQRFSELEHAPPRVVTQTAPGPKPEEKCFMENIIRPGPQTVPAAKSSIETFIYCNYERKAPLVLGIEYDKPPLSYGPIEFPEGRTPLLEMYTHEKSVVFSIQSPSILPFQPFLVTAYGQESDPPRATQMRITIINPEQ